ncbi:hypothetical protein BLA29_012478 [Euroglyphus maynei]|uniref:Uncharacterized protein n=1 Tax=Euroglyphus maynei TaxID=6958 RepID=A0A1Y3AQ88_EURMA|nr:hypothetical protein BLA29_012478 [Euroglyphus maynei]
MAREKRYRRPNKRFRSVCRHHNYSNE